MASTSPAEKKVMVVDDDYLTCKMLKTVLENRGFQAAAVMDGGEALAHIQDYSPDLVILDLMLPNHGGLEILRGMQECGQRKIPVIIMTGRQVDQEMRDMLKLEGNVLGVIVKPFRHDRFMKAVHHVLGTKPHSISGTGPAASKPVPASG